MSSYEAAIEVVQVERMCDHYLDSPELRGTSDGKVYTPQAMHEMIADYMGRLVRIE